MAEGYNTTTMIMWTALAFIAFCITVTLSIYSAKNNYWKGQGKDTQNWLIVFVTAMAYLTVLLFSFLLFVFVLINGWPWNDILYYIVVLAYTAAMFLNIFVWIKRLESVFTDSVFELTNRVVFILKWLFIGIVAVGLITLVVFLADAPQAITWPLTIFWLLLFVSEIVFLLWLFVNKLGRLKQLAQFSLKSSEKDESQLIMIHKIWSLQIKLTILAWTTIISTLLFIPISMTLSGVGDIVCYFLDSCVGFIAVYCALKPHSPVYERMCCACIGCCNLCNQHESINQSLGEQIEEIQSRTSGHTQQMTQTIDVGTDATKRNSVNSTAQPSQNLSESPKEAQERETTEYTQTVTTQNESQ